MGQSSSDVGRTRNPMTIHIPGAASRGQGKLIPGYNPDTGRWSEDESVGVVPRLLGKLRKGAGEVNASLNAGVAHTTVHGWREKGRAIAEQTSSTDRMDLPVGDRIYVDFAMAVAMAKAGHEIDCVDVVAEGVKKDPELALKVLARRHPHWREQKGVDVTSKGESVVVQDRIADVLTRNPDLAAKAEDLYLSVAAAAGEEGLDDDE